MKRMRAVVECKINNCIEYIMYIWSTLYVYLITGITRNARDDQIFIQFTEK